MTSDRKASRDARFDFLQLRVEVAHQARECTGKGTQIVVRGDGGGTAVAVQSIVCCVDNIR